MTQIEWTAPIVLGAKRDVFHRFRAHYLKLNVGSQPDIFSTLLMAKCINFLVDGAELSMLQESSFYRQVEIKNGGLEKSVLTSNHELFRFVKMPLGQRIAPSTFQRIKDVVHPTAWWQSTEVYLDAIVVFVGQQRNMSIVVSVN